MEQKQTNILISGASGKMGHAVAAAIAGRTDCITCAGVDLHTESYADFKIYPKFSDLPEKPDVLWNLSQDWRWRLKDKI